MAEDNKKSESTGMYTAGFVLGIIGIVFAFIPLMYWLAYVLGGLALVFGIVGLVKKAEGNKPLTATILGAVALVVAIVMNIVWVNVAHFGLGLVEDIVNNSEITNTINDFLDGYESDALGKTVEVKINGYVDYDGTLADKALSVTIKNIYNKTLSFSVSIEALDENGDRIDTSDVYVDSLAPGQSATEYAFDYSSLDEEELEGATFRIYRATSY